MHKGVYNSKEWAEPQCPSTGEFKGVSYKAVLCNSEKENKKITPANITLVNNQGEAKTLQAYEFSFILLRQKSKHGAENDNDCGWRKVTASSNESD